MAAYSKGQKPYNGPYSSDFSESKVQELSRDGYMPGDKPGTFQDNTQSKKYQLDLSRVDSDESRALQKDWHRTAGFTAEVSRGTQHPKKSSVSSWPSRGTDTASPDQGSVGGFKWR
jgi:hypothetical protein